MHLFPRCDGIHPTNEALRPCVNASRSVISRSIIMIVVLFLLPYWAPESMRCRHHWQPFPRTAPLSTRAGSSMLSSFPVAWKLKGCTERAPNRKVHFQWRVAAASAALSTSSPAARGPDGSRAKHWLNRLFGSALICWRIFLAWKTQNEKEGESAKDVSMCVCDQKAYYFLGIFHTFSCHLKATASQFQCRFVNKISVAWRRLKQGERQTSQVHQFPRDIGSISSSLFPPQMLQWNLNRLFYCSILLWRI